MQLILCICDCTSHKVNIQWSKPHFDPKHWTSSYLLVTIEQYAIMQTGRSLHVKIPSCMHWGFLLNMLLSTTSQEKKVRDYISMSSFCYSPNIYIYIYINPCFSELRLVSRGNSEDVWAKWGYSWLGGKGKLKGIKTVILHLQNMQQKTTHSAFHEQEKRAQRGFLSLWITAALGERLKY